VPANQLLQFVKQAPKVKQAPARCQGHQKIHIAVLISGTPCERPKDPDIGCAVFGRQRKNLLSLGDYYVLYSHKT
jgi:hypothetical protein